MRVVESKVARVTIYTTGAVVTRRVRVSSKDTTICLDGLPVELADDSLRVVCLGSARVVEQAVVRFAVPAGPAEAPPALEDELAELQLARALADRRRETLRAAAEQLSALELRRRLGPEDGVPSPKSPTRARLQWLGLQAQQLRRVQDDLADAREECRLATERLHAATAAAEASSSARQARLDEARKAIEVRLSAGEDAEIEVSYRVAQCRWAPSYVLRIREGESAVLEMRAFVAQQTGEDWTEAELSVSTASTMQWVELPEMKALKIGRREPSTKRPGWRAAPQNTDALYEDFDSARARTPRMPDAAPEPEPDDMDLMLGGEQRPPSRKKRSARPGSAGAKPSPMPPPAAAPMAASAPGPVVRNRGRVSSAPVAKARRASFGAMAGSADGAADDGRFDVLEEAMPMPEVGGPELPAELSVPRGLMDYGALRMAGPEAMDRGTLQNVRPPALEAKPAMTAPSGHAWLPRSAEFDYTYQADGHHSVPSDGAPHSVAVLEASPALDRRYVCVPGQSSDVYRLYAARNPLDAPLPSGPLDVYQNGQFSLTTPLEAVAPGGRFELGLGVEQGIKVARRVSFEEDTEGLLKRQHAFEHHVEVEIQNLLKQAVALEIRERVPVPARRDDTDVEVAERRVEPRWDAFEPAGEELQGGRRWKVTVPPEERMTLSAQWVVRVPRGRELVGGNRRAN